MQKVASVHKGFTGISIETTGGGQVHQIQPWNTKYRQQAVSEILKLLEDK